MTPREQSLQDHRDRIQRELKDAKALPVAREVPRPIPAEPRVPRLRKKKDDPTRLRSGPPPYGLKDGSDAGIEIIKEIFRLAARGWSLRRIRQTFRVGMKLPRRRDERLRGRRQHERDENRVG